jgi:single-strand DNA-binding protein
MYSAPVARCLTAQSSLSSERSLHQTISKEKNKMALQYNVIIPNVLSEATIVARVTKDAESRFTPSGTQVTNISVVVSRRYQVDNEWKDQSRFMTVTVWGDAAKRAADIKKNNILAISFSAADLEARPYTSNAGEAKAELKINRATVSRFAWVNGDGGGNETVVGQDTDVSLNEAQGIDF